MPNAPRQTDALTVTQICEAITDAIRNGQLAPGQRLAEIDFAQRLGVSRPSVREAFRQLSADGLLFAQPYRGVSVRHMTRREIDDLFVVRATLEGLAVRLATPLSDADTARLDAIQNELDEACQRRDLNSMSRGNMAFHMFFADVTGNDLLRDILRRIANNAYWLQFRLLVADEQVFETNLVHRDIVAAIRNRDAARAEQLMIQHVDHTRQMIQCLPDGHFAPNDTH